MRSPPHTSSASPPSPRGHRLSVMQPLNSSWVSAAPARDALRGPRSEERLAAEPRTGPSHPSGLGEAEKPGLAPPGRRTSGAVCPSLPERVAGHLCPAPGGRRFPTSGPRPRPPAPSPAGRCPGDPHAGPWRLSVRLRLPPPRGQVWALGRQPGPGPGTHRAGAARTPPARSSPRAAP